MEWLQSLLFGEDSTRSTNSNSDLRARRSARRKRRRGSGGPRAPVQSPMAEQLAALEARIKNFEASEARLDARVKELESEQANQRAQSERVERHHRARDERMESLRQALVAFAEPIAFVECRPEPPTARPHFPSTMALVDRA